MTKIGRWSSPLILSLIAFAVVFLCHFGRLAETTHASGWDAYFYLVQVKAMVEEGRMHSPDSSPVYSILKYIYWASGDYELAFQILCAGLASLFVALITTLAFQHTRSYWIAVILTLWCASSASLAYFGANFPKNLLGIDFMLVLIWASNSNYKWLQIPAFILSAITHRLTAGLSLIYIILKRISWKTIALFSGIALLGALIASLLPGMLHWSDLKRFEFVTTPQLPAWSATKLLDLWRTQPLWAVEIMLLQLVCVWAGWNFIKRNHFIPQKTTWLRSLFGLILILSFPFLEMTPTSMGYRFFLTTLLLIPLLAIPMLEFMPVSVRKITASAMIIGCFFIQPYITPQQFDPDYAYYHSLSLKAGEHLNETDAELVVAHNGLAEVFTFKNNLDAMPWVPEYEISPKKLYRIAFGIEAFEIEAVLGRKLKGKHHQLDFFYLLLLEEEWQAFVTETERIGEEEIMERIYTWENPSRKRPGFLLRNQPDQ